MIIYTSDNYGYNYRWTIRQICTHTHTHTHTHIHKHTHAHT